MLLIGVRNIQLKQIKYAVLHMIKFIVHIEKSDRNIQGAYQMLARREAEKYCVGDVKYVNREDDAGDEGLRRSKLAYRPLYIAEKYTVMVK